MLWLLDIIRRVPSPVRWLAIVLLAAGLGYAYGRGAAPAKVVTQEREVVKLQYQDRVVVQYRQAKARVVYRDIVRTVTVERRPDGSSTTTTTTADKSKDATSTNTQTASHTDTTVSETGVRLSTRTVTNQAGWRFGVLAGLEVRGPGGLFSTLPSGVTMSRAPLGPVWLGAQLDHSVAGPVSVGGWSLTNGRDFMLGASLSLSF
jgi:hypothetical protein